jgi:lipoate-protein ligase A
MDDRESTHRLSARQAASKVFRRRDGGWAVAHDEDGVTFIGRLVIVPDRTALDEFENAIQFARDQLKAAMRVVASVEPDARPVNYEILEGAFAEYDFRMARALEVLREAMRP